MCGIAGYLDLARALNPALQCVTARTMTDAIRHRGPDHGAEWLDEADGVALGYRRLAILDLSPAGQQPMHSADGRFVMVYNGEVYNYPEFRAELEQRGHRFHGHSDTEAMLAAIAAWGVEAAVERFNGMFAFALWDRHERALWLARDRAGIKPLYYGLWQGALLFGSELKALAAYPGFAPSTDRDAQALYLRLGYIPAPHTMYRGIHKLPPGCLLRAALGEAKASELPAPRPYWSPQRVFEAGAHDPFTGSYDEAVEALDALMRDAVRQQMISDVPLGAFLSGGVDSSTVVAMMQTQHSRPVQTFTIGFSEAMYDEAPFARAVAAHLRTDHSEQIVTPAEAMAVIERLPAMYDEPFADSSQIPTFLVSQHARRQVTVVLSGDGGDELFAGYERYTWARGVWERAGALPRPMREAAASTLRAVPHAAWNAAGMALGRKRVGDKAVKLAGALTFADQADLYRKMHTLWPEPSRLVEGAHEPATALDGVARAAHVAPADAYVRWMQQSDLALYLPDDVLTKVDRASMATSLEVRVPLLDHRVIAFAARLPLAYTLGKRVLRDVLYRQVPRTLIDRPKAGFGVPIGDWLRGPLRAWAESRLDSQRLRACGLTPEPIRAAWAAHLAGRGAWAHALWAVCLW
jgi:asparagine synthase (glutamine-hydrolysing)